MLFCWSWHNLNVFCECAGMYWVDGNGDGTSHGHGYNHGGGGHDGREHLWMAILLVWWLWCDVVMLCVML